jgi:hypothetical protein
MKYRKKPVVIDATKWQKNGDHPEDGPVAGEGAVVGRYRAPRGLAALGECQLCDWDMDAHGWIDSYEGGHIVCPGDWIITGVEGEHYPCKPSVFAATYEDVEP